MIRYVGSAIAGMVTLVAILWGLSKAIAPVTDATVFIIGELDLFGSAETAPDPAWCQREENPTLRLAESFRKLCDDARADCGPDCVRVTTSRWSEDCSARTAVRVCIPHNPLLGADRDADAEQAF